MTMPRVVAEGVPFLAPGRHVPCMDHVPLFELIGDISHRPSARILQRAREICGTCPVTSECLAHALECDEQWGMWGALTADERLRYGSAEERRQRLAARRARNTAARERIRSRME